MTQPPAHEILTEIMKCDCNKVECQQRCSCKKNHLKCTVLCKCTSCENRDVEGAEVGEDLDTGDSFNE